MTDPQKLTHVYTGANSADTHHIRALLEGDGIQAVVMGDVLGAGRGELPMTQQTLPSVWVHHVNAKKAAALVAEYMQPADPNVPQWECSNCHESVEGQFNVCWKCGTTRDGETPADFEGVELDAKSCQKCGYDLRVTTSNACPECGTEI